MSDYLIIPQFHFILNAYEARALNVEHRHFKRGWSMLHPSPTVFMPTEKYWSLQLGTRLLAEDKKKNAQSLASSSDTANIIRESCESRWHLFD